MENIEKIQKWIDNISIYPPAYMYAGKPQTKQERSAASICEVLYRFNHGKDKNALGDLKSSWRDVEVICKLSKFPPVGVLKHEYIEKVFIDFIENAKNSISKMDSVFKQHQALNEYYKTWRVSFQDIKALSEKLKYEMKK